MPSIMTPLSSPPIEAFFLDTQVFYDSVDFLSTIKEAYYQGVIWNQGAFGVSLSLG
jgi:hypothetical protein